VSVLFFFFFFDNQDGTLCLYTFAEPKLIFVFAVRACIFFLYPITNHVANHHSYSNGLVFVPTSDFFFFFFLFFLFFPSFFLFFFFSFFFPFFFFFFFFFSFSLGPVSLLFGDANCVPFFFFFFFCEFGNGSDWFSWTCAISSFFPPYLCRDRSQQNSCGYECWARGIVFYARCVYYVPCRTFFRSMNKSHEFLRF